MAATIASAIFADYFWIRPAGQLIIPHITDLINFVLFLASGLLISYLFESGYRPGTGTQSRRTVKACRQA